MEDEIPFQSGDFQVKQPFSIQGSQVSFCKYLGSMFQTLRGKSWAAPTREDLSLTIQWLPRQSRHPDKGKDANGDGKVVDLQFYWPPLAISGNGGNCQQQHHHRRENIMVSHLQSMRPTTINGTEVCSAILILEDEKHLSKLKQQLFGVEFAHFNHHVSKCSP